MKNIFHIQVIKKVVDNHPLSLKNPEPDVFVDNLGESSVNIMIRIWGPTTEWYSMKKELLWKIKQALEKESIQIPFPQRVVWFADKIQTSEESLKES